MEHKSQISGETEIDFAQSLRVLLKLKKTFLAIFLLVLFLGVLYVQFSPRIFKVSTTVQPLLSDNLHSSGNKAQAVWTLKGLILKGFFSDKVRSNIGVGFSDDFLAFQASIPEQPGVLMISLDVDGPNMELGKEALIKLFDIIERFYSDNQGLEKERSRNQVNGLDNMLSDQKKILSLQEKIGDVVSLEERLSESLIEANIRATKLRLDQEVFLKNKISRKDSEVDFSMEKAGDLSGDIEDCFVQIKGIEDQLIRLSALKENLELKIQEIRSEISDKYEKNLGVGLITGLRMIERPRVSPKPISPNKKKIIVFSVMYGLFFGFAAVFLQEFWLNNFRKK